jgi:hypothetical protein
MILLFHSASITIAAGLKGSTFPFHTEPQYEITGGFVDGMGMSNLFAATIYATPDCPLTFQVSLL